MYFTEKVTKYMRNVTNEHHCKYLTHYLKKFDSLNLFTFKAGFVLPFWACREKNLTAMLFLQNEWHQKFWAEYLQTTPDQGPWTDRSGSWNDIVEVNHCRWYVVILSFSWSKLCYIVRLMKKEGETKFAALSFLLRKEN